MQGARVPVVVQLGRNGYEEIRWLISLYMSWVQLTSSIQGDVRIAAIAFVTYKASHRISPDYNVKRGPTAQVGVE